MAVRPGDTIDLAIDRPVAGGRMLARAEGRVVLVSGAIPGETVRARVTRADRHVAMAQTIEVLAPSADRRAAGADPDCGGLLFSHIDYARQLSLKGEIVQDAFRRLARHPLEQPPAVRGATDSGYRLRARLHVRDGRVGFFREGTHQICDAAMTRQLLPESHQAVDAVVARLGARLGDVEHIVVAENIRASERVLHLVPREGVRIDPAALPSDAVPGVTGLTIAAGPRIAVVSGTATVTDTAADLALDDVIDASAKWTRHAAAFFQGHRALVGALVRHVVTAATGDRVVDLYAGVGLFSIALAARGASVVAVEGDRTSGADLTANAEPWADRVLVARQSVEEATARRPGETPDTVVVDPPRTGASKAAIEGLIRWRAPRIVYVSCDPPTLARDAARLFEAGYTLAGLEAFDMFPNTPHVETVAVFER
ncbi:MAG TPA: TRAM domain-containing protein [Vicinamibacterales bacterium]|nr:TRAM domain-containing protein [Vicinamibacterales bacterium]